jgi:hypothetical protein
MNIKEIVKRMTPKDNRIYKITAKNLNDCPDHAAIFQFTRNGKLPVGYKNSSWIPETFTVEYEVIKCELIELEQK